MGTVFKTLHLLVIYEKKCLMLEKAKLFSVHFFYQLRKTRLKNRSTVQQEIKRNVLISTYRESRSAVITAIGD